MGDVRRYVISYLDENGNTISHGCVETYKSNYIYGDIVEICYGQKVRIDFEIY